MPIDERIGSIASRQHGIVTAEQLRSLGITRARVRRRIEAGALIPLHRGVFAVGHVALHPLAPVHAAVLACGSRACASHRSAAVLWGLLDPPEDDVPHVTATGARLRRDIHVHRAQLPGRDVTRRHGIPVTTVPRLIVDVAETEPPQVVARVLGEAEAQRRVTRRALAAERPRWNGRHGVKVVDEILAGDLDPAPTRSVLEDLFLPLVRSAGLPRPLTNVVIAGKLVDALWPRHRVVVELDGRRWHDTPTRFESDRAERARIVAAGYVVLAFTWRRLQREPTAVVAELAATLARHAPVEAA